MFDSFGNPASAMGPGASSYGYAGEWADASGLQYLRARYYIPIQGRFFTSDPFPGILVQPATLNPYLYVLNNPVLMTDPSGEIAPILILAALGFAGGALLNTWQQTNGFTSWCHFDVMQALAWGVGGAAAVSSFAILSLHAIGMVGLGLQGLAMGLNSLGLSLSIITTLWMGGISTTNLAAAASIWLWTGQTSNPLTRLPIRSANTDKTSGILVVGKNEIELESGWNGPASQMPQKSQGFNIVTKTHVEGHASALMNQNNWTIATLYMNNAPCKSCSYLLPRMLPPDSTLKIIGPNGFNKIFTGLPR